MDIISYLDELINFLGSIYTLSPECITYLRKIVQSKEVHNNEILLEIGEINRNLYFIRKGVLECYYYVNETPVRDWFFWEGHTVVSIGSFYDQVASEDRIVAKEDCEVLYITKEEYDYLCETYLEFNYIARVLLQKYLQAFHSYARIMRKHKAKERYKLMLSRLPEFIQRIPLKALASWLDLDPATLSRARGKRVIDLIGEASEVVEECLFECPFILNDCGI